MDKHRGYNVRANNIRQHLLQYPGSGEPMLIVPGITSPAATWGFVAERLSASFDVHVLDVRGRGLSEAGTLDYSLDAMSDDIPAVLAATGLTNAVVLGHSMGARIAARAARKDPPAQARLILVDPPVSGPGRRPYPAKLPWYTDSIGMAAKGCSAEDMRAFCPTWSDGQLALRAEWLHTCRIDAIVAAFEGFHTDDFHTDLAQLHLPVRLIVAGGATVVQPEDMEEIQALIPHVETRVVPNAGHMIPWDDLEGFLQAVMN